MVIQAGRATAAWTSMVGVRAVGCGQSQLSPSEGLLGFVIRERRRLVGHATFHPIAEAVPIKGTTILCTTKERRRQLMEDRTLSRHLGELF